MGYLKLDKSLLDMKLTPNELSVMVHLLGVEDYRLYKNEVEDGWFYKSQTELAKECNIKSAYTFRCTINSLIDKGVLNIDRVNGLTTKFKITLSNIDRDTLSDNDMDTLSKNNRDTLSKIDTLHNTINKPGHKTILSQEKQEKKKEEKEKEVINTGPLTISDIEKEKEDNVQPMVRLSTENSTVGELVEDYINNHNGKLEYLKCSNVNGFKLSNQDSLKEMTNIYGYLSIDDYRNMFVYLHKRN